MHMTVVFPRGRPRESVASNHHKPSLPTSQTPSTAPAAAPPSCHQSSTRPPSCSCFNYINGLEFRDQPSCAKYDNTISAPTSSTNHPDPLAAPIRPVESQRWRPRAHTSPAVAQAVVAAFRRRRPARADQNCCPARIGGRGMRCLIYSKLTGQHRPAKPPRIFTKGVVA